MVKRQFINGAAIVEVDQQGILGFRCRAEHIAEGRLAHQLVVDIEAGAACGERYIHRLLIHHLGLDVRQVGGDNVMPFAIINAQRRRAIGRGECA